MILFITCSLFILIFFLPIPLKIKINYYNKNIYFKIYKYTIYSSENGVESKYLRKILVKNKKKDITSTKDNKKTFSFKKLYKNLNSNKIKPKLKFFYYINYGIEDAALCAILYGILYSTPNILYFLLNIIFNVKSLDFDIKPNFDTLTFSFGITSIFYFNIANIIYMSFLLFKSMEIKEVAPNKGRTI